MSRVQRKLPDKLALRAPVAFTKGMNGIDLAKVVGSTLTEHMHIQTSQQALDIELAEELGQSRCKVDGWSKGSAANL